METALAHISTLPHRVTASIARIQNFFPAAAGALHLNTRRHQHVRSFEVQTQFKVIFCSCFLPAGDPSTRPRSTQYVGRWWHHDPAVAAVNPCSVQYQFNTSAVDYTDQTSRLYRPVSVVSNLCSNLSCPCISNLSNLFAWVCNVRGLCPFERS